MGRTRQTVVDAAPGAGTIFALRAVGIVFLARWLFSVSQIGYASFLNGITSSPWACINLIFLFLLVVLPGAQARAERPYHPLPRWLRQTLRYLALLDFAFAIWSIGLFFWQAGARRLLGAVIATNGWLAVAPALYLAVFWICRPRAVGRTNVAAGRFALGRYTVAVDRATQTAVVWQESRKVGQYGARELAVRWAEAGHQAPLAEDGAAVPPGRQPLRHWAAWRRGAPAIELLWNSPASAGHNRQLVFRVPLRGAAEHATASSLDTLLQQSRADFPDAAAAPTAPASPASPS